MGETMMVLSGVGWLVVAVYVLWPQLLTCIFSFHDWQYSAGWTRGPREWRGCTRCKRREVSGYDGMSVVWNRTRMSLGEFIEAEDA